ncbi:hypothetical protein A2U01_0034216, partial [Trifolium medium]|nr:hypothetical protein [Trifolium medium]
EHNPLPFHRGQAHAGRDRSSDQV